MLKKTLNPLLMLLSRFSRVRLCVTPQTAAHQAPPSVGFSRQERWSGLPFPSPVHASESEVSQSCLTLSDPMDCSLPGSSVHGIFQARVLEWDAIAFSEERLGISFHYPALPRPHLNTHHTALPYLKWIFLKRVSKFLIAGLLCFKENLKCNFPPI